MKVVLVGLGSIGKRHLANVRLLWPQVEVLVVSASSRNLPASELNGCQQVSLVEAISAAPLFAIIASPAHVHLDYAASFRDAGIPALIEKPLSHQYVVAKDFLTEQCTSPLLSLGYCLRYLPSASIVQQLIASKTLGSIYSVQAIVGQHLSQWRAHMNYHDSVSARAELGGGALLELSHELDYLLWLFGPLSVESCLFRGRSELKLSVEESADLMLSGNGQLICQLHLDFLQQVPQRRCVISGQLGRVEWDLLQNSVTLITAAGQDVLYHQASWDKNQMYLQMLQEFVAAILHNHAPPIPLQQGLAVLQLVEQAKNMAKVIY